MEIMELAELVKQDIVQLSITDTEIALLKNKYMPLVVNGIEDKTGLKIVYEARQDVKRTRVGVVKYADDLKETAIKWQKKVNTEKNRVVGELESIEAHLQGEEDKVAAEKERIRLEIEEKETARVQVRINKLAEYGFAIDYNTVKTIDDKSFEIVLNNAKNEYQKEQAAKAEAERIAREESARLEAERKELEELRKKQAEAQRIIDENNARIKKEQDEKEAAIRAEQLRQEQEKARIDREKEQMEREKRVAEAARVKAIEDANKAAEQKAEQDRQAKIKADRQLALRPDKEKLQSFSDMLSKLEVPVVKNPAAQEIVNEIKLMVNKMQAHIIKKIKEL